MVRLTAHGILVVDKPNGPTSHDVVAQARRIYGTREVGHAGTLDPMATGVLILMFGEARKLSGYLMGESKSYFAAIRFGTSTNTLDALGTIVDQCAESALEIDPERLARALSVERERVLQVPPAVSAIKVAGQRAHRLARAGQPPTFEPRAVRVEALTSKGYERGRLELEVRVSKGYYVRALARDLAAALGVPAHLEELRRLASGGFGIDEAVAWPPQAAVPLLSLEDAARRTLPSAVLTDEGAVYAGQGKRLNARHFVNSASTGDAISAWFGPDGKVVALGQRSSAEEFSVVRGFRTNTSSNEH